MTELIIGLWLGMGFAAWYISVIVYGIEDWRDIMLLPVLVLVGPVAMVTLAYGMRARA